MSCKDNIYKRLINMGFVKILQPLTQHQPAKSVKKTTIEIWERRASYCGENAMRDFRLFNLQCTEDKL